jgi:hypothetical protein
MNKIIVKDFEVNSYNFLKRTNINYIEKLNLTDLTLDEIEIYKNDSTKWNNYLNSQVYVIKKLVILFENKYNYDSFYISIKNNDISWIGFTGNYGLIKDTTNEYNIFNNFINKINNLEYSDKISHYIFINGEY